MKWISIQPLIGGMNIAAEKVFNTPPFEIISYSDIPNEHHLIEHYKKENKNVDIKIIKSNDEYSTSEKIDLVIGVPVCAGLSMLNSCSSSSKGRGCNADQNNNMYEMAKLALHTIKPKAYIFENAPTLATNMGKLVIDKLKDIAIKESYSMTVIKTSTIFHGIPQKRSRTFVIFWKSNVCPIISFYNKEETSIVDYLSLIPKEAKYFNSYISKKSLIENSQYKFLLSFFGKDFRKKFDSKNKTVNQIIINDNLYSEAYDFYKSINDDREANNIKRIEEKILKGGGIWDNSILYTSEKYIPSLTGKTIDALIHPTEDRFYTLRELIWFMGLPHNFDLINEKDIIHITQNVPVNTAEDWMREINKFLDNDLLLSNSNYALHDNFNQKTYYSNLKENENSFMSLF